MIYYLRKHLHFKYHNRDLYLLLLIGGLYSIGLFLSNTFVNVYLWRQTEDFLTIAHFQLAIAISKPVTFIFAGKLTSKIDRIIVLRLGVCFLSLFFLTVLILSEQASHFNVLLGVLLGIGYGFYWLAFNVLTFEITEPYNRVFFNGILGSLQSISGMVGPLLAGSIISYLETNVGYLTIFGISFLLFFIAVMLSFFISRRRTDGNYNLGLVFEQIFINHDWKRVVLANFSQGIRDGLFVFVITILIFVSTASEFFLGIFNLLLNGSSFILFITLTMKMKNESRKRLMFIGSLMISFSFLIVAYQDSFLSFMIYALVVGLAYPLLSVPFQSLSYDVIGKSYDARNLRIEYIVFLEVAANVGSITSILSFILTLHFFSQSKAFVAVLIVVSFSYLFIYIFSRRITLLQ